MTQRVLEQLPKALSGELPNDAECMICKEEYGTVPSENGIIEHAVLLPCLHHVGSECIALWFSARSRFRISCPMCRRMFIDPELIDDEDDEDDEENDEENDEEHGAYNGDEDNDGSGEASDRVDGREQSPRITLAPFWNARYSYLRNHYAVGNDDLNRWPSPTNPQIADCLNRAPQALLRPSPSGLLDRSLALAPYCLSYNGIERDSLVR